MSSYDAIARVYDLLWGPISAARYLPAVGGWLDAALEPGAPVVDLACGSGQVVAALTARGYRVAGVDASAAMIERARARAPGAELHVATLDALPLADASFAAAICLFDSLNHVAPAGLAAAVAEAARVLRPGGLLVFDLNTERGFVERWRGSSAEVRDDLVCVTRARYAADRGVGEYLVTAFEPAPGGTWTRADAILREHLHPPAAVRDALDAAGLGDVVVVDSERELGVARDVGRDFYRATKRGDAAP